MFKGGINPIPAPHARPHALSRSRKAQDITLLSRQAAGKLIVAYHTAAWCGPCKMIWPHVEELAKSNPDVVFLKIDVDEVKRRIVGAGTSIRV
jgi:thiol-disulfide isomerase/thioredoxin